MDGIEPFALPALQNVDIKVVAPAITLDYKVTFENGSHTLRIWKLWKQREGILIPDFCVRQL